VTETCSTCAGTGQLHRQDCGAHGLTVGCGDCGGSGGWGKCSHCDNPVRLKHGILCASCIADEIDSYDYDEDGDPEDDGLDECAMTSDGYCMLAGTEHCEWECPIVYSSFCQTPHQPKEGGHAD